jgi:4-diphosphocytidyl-2-C-methyl-D-erythritol kinase
VTPRRAALRAPAKVNLRLRVLERRADGFHALETLFLAIGLEDLVEVEVAGSGVSLRAEGEADSLGEAEDNLVVRAARAYLRESGWSTGLRLRLVKRVPAAAGLGGGSSDAAATLRLLEELSPAPLGGARLGELALALGSDVPFFLCGSPFALARGRGELLQPLPALPPAPVLVAHPGAPLPTAAAFAELAALRAGTLPPGAAELSPDGLTGWEGVAPLALNDFTAVALRRVPGTGEALAVLREEGASIALLSGSGAAVFGVFTPGATGAPGIEGAARRLEGLGWRVWRTESLARMPSPRVDREGAGP